eukprot:CAMPEP_0172624670 /NCGR_PEP_ID=MMETSP1068-20121228/138483_1 /TAXON_ID=35684 /ORGANISM="Pseudopedinella elastica, Strain CCMP716" /LENGTH=425 /DNA_ID=CAMNT_0013433721 /DNA_START=92 /DNA_END=1366 /DNA_ORIENTATION=-
MPLARILSNHRNSIKHMECTFGNYECGAHYECVPSANGGKTGTCECHIYLGYHGPDCENLSSLSYWLLVLISLSACYSLYAIWVNFKLASKLKASGHLRTDSVGQTLAFNAAFPFTVLALNLGILLTLTDVDQHQVFIRYLREIVVVVCLTIFIFSTLSVSTVWLEMAERTTTATSEPPLRSSTRRGGWHQIYVRKSILFYGISALLIVGTALSFALGSTMIASVWAASCLLLIGASYGYAGHLVFQLLHRTVAPAPPGLVRQHHETAASTSRAQAGEQTIAGHIWRTTQRMAAICVSLAFFTLLYGLQRPSTMPIHSSQNNPEHRFMAGQGPFLAILFATNHANIFIAQYLNFWEERRNPSTFRELSLASEAVPSSSSARDEALSVILETGESSATLVYDQMANRGTPPCSAAAEQKDSEEPYW